jgi:hypothetical protein
MSRERTDEFLKWRGLIDQPDARPDRVLDDKESTWQKLAERLGERRRNRLSGYRIAVACLLFALLIIPAARLFQDRHGVAGVPSRRPPGQQLPRIATSVVRRPHAVTVTASRDADGGSRAADGVVKTSAATTFGGKAVSAPAWRTNRNRLPLLAAIRVSPALIVAAPLDSAGQSLFSRPSQLSLQGVRPAPGTKELKVVHQNEIRGGGSPSPSVGATGSDRLINILLRTSGQQPAPAPPQTEDPALLKIKLSPSN